MRRFTPTALALLAASARADYLYGDEPTSTIPIPECTATSSTGSGAFFDMRPDIAWPADSGKTHKSSSHRDYYSKGYDYGKNFTMNICSSVVEPPENVVGVDETLWANVSAYYVYNDSVYSIGYVDNAFSRSVGRIPPSLPRRRIADW